jgi:hypothetical protein
MFSFMSCFDVIYISPCRKESERGTEDIKIELYYLMNKTCDLILKCDLYSIKLIS